MLIGSWGRIQCSLDAAREEITRSDRAVNVCCYSIVLVVNKRKHNDSSFNKVTEDEEHPTLSLNVHE